MRPQILIAFICLFTFSTVLGQKTNTYKYIYKFQLDKPKDISSITVDTLPNHDRKRKLSGKVIGNDLQALSFLTIILKSEDTTIYSITNDKGLFEINIEPSVYELTISGVNYISLTKNLVINDKINYNLKIKLARQAPLTWYDIHSKKELEKEDIDKIKKCVELNNSRPINCGKKNEYYVTIEI